MAKKNLLKVPKMPKWAWWGVWFLGILASLFLILYGASQVWLSTWKTYRNDEFGFSFRYPSTWHMGGTEVTKRQLDEKGVVFFWIDSQPESVVRGETETKRSSGNVEVEIEKTIGIKDFSKFKKVWYGNRMGYTQENIGVGQNTSVNGINKFYFGASKSFILEKNNYWFSVDTQSYSQNADISSDIKSYSLFEELTLRVNHWIGSTIVDSFKFD